MLCPWVRHITCCGSANSCKLRWVREPTLVANETWMFPGCGGPTDPLVSLLSPKAPKYNPHVCWCRAGPLLPPWPWLPGPPGPRWHLGPLSARPCSQAGEHWYHSKPYSKPVFSQPPWTLFHLGRFQNETREKKIKNALFSVKFSGFYLYDVFLQSKLGPNGLWTSIYI